jgi:predicted GIY-YIG superfamily endonuclease
MKRDAGTRGWFVYIVRCADRSLYTGVAVDVRKRVATHNSGKGAKYTRGRLPVRLVYQEAAESRGAALRREYAIKSMGAVEKRLLVRRVRGQPGADRPPAARLIR